jgi:hypothetical protein
MLDLYPNPQPFLHLARGNPDFFSFVPERRLPFVLTVAAHSTAAAMAGEALSVELARFATLADAMHGAVKIAGQIDSQAVPKILTILDRDQRLVLAGAVITGSVAWRHPVMSAAEARTVVTEASQLRAQASRAADWQGQPLAQTLRHRADLLEARLVDPLWRVFAARALQLAA